MSILLNGNTQVLVQGITGKEGARATRVMLDYRTDVVAGVTPKKGGLTVYGRPVFNTVAEAKKQFPEINVSTIYVPPIAARGAMLEAIVNNVQLINVMTERVPVKDTAYCLAAASERNIKIIGPSSLGAISPGVGRIGVAGGSAVREIYTPGSIGVISRSGGMLNEVSWQVRQAGLGQSTAVHIGGDLLVGVTYADLLRMFEKDEQTKAVVIFAEYGGRYEFEIVDAIQKKEYTKPLAIYVGGKFAGSQPEGAVIGHAGAIVGRGEGARDKEKALREAGVMVAERYEQLVDLVRVYG